MSQNEDELFESHKQLSKQIFQLAYFGKISPEYASSLEIEERNYMYRLLVEQFDEEKKRNEKEASTMKAQQNKIKSSSRPRR